MVTRFSMLPALALGALLAGQAAAQTAPATPIGTPLAKPATPSLGRAATERRIAELHARLGINPAEEKAFGAFAQVMRENGQRMETLVAQGLQVSGSADAVGQMRLYTLMAQTHADDMQRLTGAFSALYDVLSPDQRHRADVSLRDFIKSRRGTTG